MGTLQNTTLSQDLSGLLNIILTDASNLANTVPDPLAQLGAFSSYPFLTAKQGTLNYLESPEQRSD